MAGWVTRSKIAIFFQYGDTGRQDGYSLKIDCTKELFDDELARHRGLKLAVVTDAHNGNTLKRLRKAGLEEFFDVIITMDMSGKAKPSPEPFLLGMRKLGVSTPEMILVGDSIRRDIVPAKALGMLTVHAIYGDRNFHDGKKDGADYTISEIGEIIEVCDGYR